MDRLRTALIGCGKVGQIHASALLSLPESEFVAACDPQRERAEAFAALHGTRAFADVGEMLAETGAQAVVIGTPHPLHAAAAIAAMEAGVHVLVEKPMAASLGDCDAMLATAARTGMTLGVISQRRFYEPVLRLKHAIDAGKIGTPVLGVFQMFSWRDRAYYQSDPWRGKWATEGGGVLVNQSPHQLDLLQWLMGNVEEVSGYWANLNHPEIEVEDTAVASLRFRGGGLGSIVTSLSQKPGLFTKVHIHGSNGASVGVETDRGATFVAGMTEIAEPPLNDLWTVPGEEHALAEFQAEDRARFRQIDPTTHYHALQIQDFLRAILDRRPPLVTGEDGRKVVALFTAIYRSQRDRRPISLPLEAEPAPAAHGSSAASFPARARTRPSGVLPMDLSSFVSPVAGARTVRRAVNAGFHAYSRRRMRAIDRLDPVAVQEQTLRALVRAAAPTRFGRDHGFAEIRSVADFQRRVPLRTYENLWDDYLKGRYPVFQDLTWPGKIPYLALSSGTTTGATKYIPVSRAMVASNRKAAQTMVAADLRARPGARIFHGRIFFLGGSTNLEEPAPGVAQGDLSGIAAATAGPLLRPYTFPPLDLALDPNWDRKLITLVERSWNQPITLVSGVSSCLVTLFQRLLERSGKATVAEVWPRLEVVVHGGVKFDPYRNTFATLLGSPAIRLMESYPCSEGFIAFGDPATGLLRLLLDHGIFYEFVPVDELGSERPSRHWLGDLRTGVNYAIVVTTCAGMWAHVIGDTVRFESLRPPLLTFTGRTRYTLSAFGEHVISEEVEAAVAVATARTGASVRDWHAGPVFHEPLGHHLFVFEFLGPPADLAAFRAQLDDELSVRNAHYQWFRANGGGLPLPALVSAGAGGFDDWMRSRGQLGGQHKVPRMDSSGKLTAELVAFLRAQGRIRDELPEGSVP